jgi:putative spermidine/putrescine transport system substrate-binding protein
MTDSYSRRSVIRLGAIGAASGLAAPMVISSVARAQSNTLYVNSYGGELDVAYRKAYCDPFTKQTGINVKLVNPVSFAKLRAQVQTKAFEWDITNMNETEFSQAEADGLTEKIDLSIVKDVPASIILGNGVGAYNLGTALVYRKDKFPNGGPRNWADFWDVNKFPGDRSLFNRPFTCLAYALLADGVPRDRLYPMDLDRAFRKMDAIKPHIKVWWTQASQTQQLIRDGEVHMIGMWTSRAASLIADKVPIEIVWDGAENYTTYWFVPRGTPKAETAWRFANFAAQPEQQAAFTSLVPYGPVNPGALKLVSDERMRVTPSWPANREVAFQHDAAWLESRLGAIRERWTQWLAS